MNVTNDMLDRAVSDLCSSPGDMDKHLSDRLMDILISNWESDDGYDGDSDLSKKTMDWIEEVTDFKLIEECLGQHEPDRDHALRYSDIF